MEAIEKLSLSAAATCFEQDDGGRPRPDLGLPGCPPAGRAMAVEQPEAVAYRGHEIPIYRAALPGGGRSPLLKAMLTTACERGCRYCSFRAGRDMRRVTFRAQEMAELYHDAYVAGVVRGLFLSTGIFAGGANTQNHLLDCAEILRTRKGYRGYLHLKLMPGSEFGQVERAMTLADRVSINLEGPNPERLRTLAPEKKFVEELLAPLRWADRIRREQPPQRAFKGRWATTSTQFVVGAVGESDLELLSTTETLFRRWGLRRTYFEAFNPVPGTPFEDLPSEDPVRQQRLYEASYLLRDYGFSLEDFNFEPDGCLPLGVDPKRGYADAHLVHAPVELNTADREALMRVPGIGPRSSERILRVRGERRLVDLSQVRRMGIIAERAAPYVLLDGKRPERQLSLFTGGGDPSK